MLRTLTITALCLALPTAVIAQVSTPSAPVPITYVPVPTEPPKEPPPLFDPNDAELSELWEKIEAVQTERNALQAEYNRQTARLRQEETAAQGTFLHKLGERRIEELQRRRTAEEIDTAKIGLTVLNFPEIAGSTSCSNLARLLVCRTLDVPYKWTVRVEIERDGFNSSGGYHVANLQLVVDVEKAGERAGNIVAELTRNFSGTHEAYRGLLEKSGTPQPGMQRQADLPPNVVPVPPMPAVWDSQPVNAPPAYQPPAITVPVGPPTLTPLAPVVAGQPQPQIPPAELIIVARKPSADELALAKEQNVEFDVRPLALDSLVFLVNRRNPVQSLTLEQILEIYDMHDFPFASERRDTRYAVANWERFGGRAGNIRPYERERNSGSRELMDDFIAEHRKPVREGQVALRTQANYAGLPTQTMSMTGPMFALDNDVHGIAYSVFQYEHFMHLNMNVRPVAINGIAASSETIGDGTYPAITGVYVVTKKGIAEGSPAAKLRDFLLGEAGQRLVYESGHMPVGRIL